MLSSKEKYINLVTSDIILEAIENGKRFNGKSDMCISKSMLESVGKGEIKKVLKSFEPQERLNGKLWIGKAIDSRVRLQLLDIADNFIDTLGVSWVKPKDIIITGSICNYNWSEYSDIDLHIIYDFNEVDDRVDFVKNYFDAKKKVWNDTHEELSIYGFPVEVYVQDSNEEHVSSAIYSLEKNEWIIKPNKDKMESLKADKGTLITKTLEIIGKVDQLEKDLSKEKDKKKIEVISKKAKKIFDKIKQGRQADLKKNGELGPLNVLFKILRRCGYLGKLSDLKSKTYDKIMTLK
jgi:predicted nucleotidyltransferase